MGRMGRFTAACVVNVILALACAAPARHAPPPPESPLVGTAVEIAAQDLRGAEVQVHADTGKVRVVDFFASWCDPCRAQLPSLDGLAREYGARGLAVYAVSFDDDRAAVDAFVANHGVSLPVLWDQGGQTLSKALGVSRLPTTLVLDRKGIVRFVHRGYGPTSDARLEREVTQLLSE